METFRRQRCREGMRTVVYDVNLSFRSFTSGYLRAESRLEHVKGHEAAALVATATFSPNGSCGDLIWDGSLTFELYTPAFGRETSTFVLPITPDGIGEVPFRAVLSGGIEAASAAVFEALSFIQSRGLIRLAKRKRKTNRLFLFGTSGDVLVDLEPLSRDGYVRESYNKAPHHR